MVEQQTIQLKLGRLMSGATACWLLIGLLFIPISVPGQSITDTVPTPLRDRLADYSGSVASDATPAIINDKRLVETVTFKAKGKTLRNLLKSLTDTTGVAFSAADDIALRRVTVFADHLSLLKFMRSMKTTLGFQWRILLSVGNKTPAAYEIFRSEGVRKQEEKLATRSELRRERDEEAQRDAVLAAIQNTLAAGNNSDPSLQLLSNMTPNELHQASVLASQPTGVVGSQDRLESHLMGSTPFSALPTGVQQSLSRVFDGTGNAVVGGGNYATPTGTLAQSSIGLIAADGGLRLSIVSPDGSIWVSPFAAVQRRGLPGIDSDDDMDPEVEELLGQARVVYQQVMSNALYQKSLRFPSSVARIKLADVLESVHKQTGISIVCNDFLRSSQSVYASLLTDQESYPLHTALDQIAKAFAHQMIYREGVLSVKTVALGADLCCEPPGLLFDRLLDLSLQHKPLTQGVVLDICKLTRRQLDTLITRRVPGVPLYTLYHYDLLHLYGILTPSQRLQAALPQGLSSKQLTSEQHQLFMLTEGIGVPSHKKEADLSQQAGLYIRGTQDMDSSAYLTLIVVHDTPSGGACITPVAIIGR